MKKTNSIIIISNDSYDNAKEVCDKIKDTDFKTLEELIDLANEDLILSEGCSHNEDLVEVMEVSEFVERLNNSTLNIENYFVANFSIIIK